MRTCLRMRIMSPRSHAESRARSASRARSCMSCSRARSVSRVSSHCEIASTVTTVRTTMASSWKRRLRCTVLLARPRGTMRLGMPARPALERLLHLLGLVLEVARARLERVRPVVEVLRQRALAEPAQLVRPIAQRVRPRAQALRDVEQLLDLRLLRRRPLAATLRKRTARAGVARRGRHLDERRERQE